MKPLIALMLSGLLAVTGQAAEIESGGESTDSRYYFFLHSPGPAWNHDQPVFRQDWTAHLAYMQELRDSGQLMLGGPFKDDSGAFGIVKAESVDQARALVEADPAVESGLVMVEVRPWHPVVIEAMQPRPW